MKNTVKLADVGYIHAGPTSGKSTLVAAALKQGINVIDTDVITYGWFMTSEMRKLISEAGQEPWKAKGQLNLIWDVVRRGTLAMADMIAEQDDATIITNLYSDADISDLYTNSFTFFREPEDLVQVFNSRREEKGKTGSSMDVKVAESWFAGWSAHKMNYSKAVTLKVDEYLADFFDIEVSTVDAKSVDRYIHDTLYSKWRKKGYFDLVEPTPKLHL